MKLSIVIVNYNTLPELRKCLRSVFSSEAGFGFEVFVVDNASADGSASMVKSEFPEVNLIENADNLGYAKANNVALKKAQGQYCLLLNPDVVVTPETFDKMISFMDNDPMVGISGCRVVKPDGSLDKASRRSFPNLKNSLLHFLGLGSDYNLDLPDDQIAEIDSVVGAFLLIREEVIEKIGLLDEAFFMYGEDLDWCYRAKAAGYKVMYAPITTVVHHKGSASKKTPKKALYEFHRAMWIFYDKHYGSQHNFLVNYLVKLGIWLRYYLKRIQNAIRREKYVSK